MLRRLRHRRCIVERLMCIRCEVRISHTCRLRICERMARIDLRIGRALIFQGNVAFYLKWRYIMKSFSVLNSGL